MDVNVAWAALACDLPADDHRAVIGQVGLDRLITSVHLPKRQRHRRNAAPHPEVTAGALRLLLEAASVSEAAKLWRRVRCDDGPAVLLDDPRSSVRGLVGADAATVLWVIQEALAGRMPVAAVAEVWQLHEAQHSRYDSRRACSDLDPGEVAATLVRVAAGADEVLVEVAGALAERLDDRFARRVRDLATLAGLLQAATAAEPGDRLARGLSKLRAEVAQAMVWHLDASDAQDDQGLEARALRVLDDAAANAGVLARLGEMESPTAQGAVQRRVDRMLVAEAPELDAPSRSALARRWEHLVGAYTAQAAGDDAPAAAGLLEELTGFARRVADAGGLDALAVPSAERGAPAVEARARVAAVLRDLGATDRLAVLEDAAHTAAGQVEHGAVHLQRDELQQLLADAGRLAALAEELDDPATGDRLRATVATGERILAEVGDPRRHALAAAAAAGGEHAPAVLAELRGRLGEALVGPDGLDWQQGSAVLRAVVRHHADGELDHGVCQLQRAMWSLVGRERVAPMMDDLLAEAVAAGRLDEALLVLTACGNQLQADVGVLEVLVRHDLPAAVKVAATQRSAAQLDATTTQLVLDAASRDDEVARAAVKVDHPDLRLLGRLSEQVAGSTLPERRSVMQRLAQQLHDAAGAAGLQTLSALVEGWDGTWGELRSTALRLACDQGQGTAAVAGLELQEQVLARLGGR